MNRSMYELSPLVCGLSRFVLISEASGVLIVTEMNPRMFEPRILKVTKEALAEGAKLSEIARELAPLIGRTRLYAWVEKWKKQGKL